MSITLNQIYAWKATDEYSPARHPYDLLDGLKVLSLDACASLYRNLFLPMSFDKNCKEALQTILNGFDRKLLQTDRDNEDYLLFVFNELKDIIGIDKTIDIGEWLGASEQKAADDFDEHLKYIIKKLSDNRTIDKMPIRIERYLALRDLLEDTTSPGWDDQLHPSELKSAWDKKIYAAQVSTDPDDQYNYWSPNASASLRSYCMITRISLENSMRTPMANRIEIKEINSWLNRNSSQQFNGDESFDNLDITEVFLRHRMKEEYLRQGLICK